MLSQESLQNAVEFIAYIDQLKKVIRENGLFDGSRKENTAEHSWHAALSAFVLAPYANSPVDIYKVSLMLLIHDLVEIETGDISFFATAARKAQTNNEAAATEKVFARLPTPLSEALKECWHEFEARQTPEAKFAKAIDRFLPFFSNFHNGGFSWQPHGISRSQAQDVARIIHEGSSSLGALVDEMIEKAVNQGFLRP